VTVGKMPHVRGLLRVVTIALLALLLTSCGRLLRSGGVPLPGPTGSPTGTPTSSPVPGGTGLPGGEGPEETTTEEPDFPG
jgi:hypothetical protein